MPKSFSVVAELNPAMVRTSVQALPSVDFWSLRSFVLVGRLLQAPMRIEATAIFFKKSAIIHDVDCWPVEQPLASDLSDNDAY